MEDNYKLVGVINLFEVLPDFVIPVFKLNNRYYMQVGSENKKIISSFELVKLSTLQHLIMLSCISYNKKSIIKKIGDEAIFAFATSKNKIIVGEYDELKDFLMNYEPDNECVKNIIEEFLNL